MAASNSGRVDHNGAWDYAADTRGSAVGGMAECCDREWSLRYGLFAMPAVATGIDMDWALRRDRGPAWLGSVRAHVDL